MNRGGLLHSALFVVNAVAHNYAVEEKLSKEVLLKFSDQRPVVTDLTGELLINDESSDFHTCDDGHARELDTLVLKQVLRRSTNLKHFFFSKMNAKILEAESKSKTGLLEALS